VKKFLYLFFDIFLERGVEWIQINELIYLMECDEVRWDFGKVFEGYVGVSG
jgi:hypothetical protein